jgi:hypothetical protein
MARKRDRGMSWRAILDREDAPALIDLLRRSATNLASAIARFTHAMARALKAEGESHRSIAQRLRVSHQRVGKLLGRS